MKSPNFCPVFSVKNFEGYFAKKFKICLNSQGIEIASTDAIFLPPEVSAIAGPNFELEAKLLRFYLVVGFIVVLRKKTFLQIEKAYIVPMLGRLSHISIDESKQVRIL